jgi:hypothetical protein
MGEGIQVYLTLDHSGQQIVILTTTWWWRTDREKRAVNKHISHTFRMERFNLKNLNEVEDNEKIRVDMSHSSVELSTTREATNCGTTR